MHKAREEFTKEKGQDALQPWNMGFMMSGEITAKLNPYFPFEKAVERWGTSFSRMDITYKKAEMNLDLLDRPHKYSVCRQTFFVYIFATFDFSIAQFFLCIYVCIIRMDFVIGLNQLGLNLTENGNQAKQISLPWLTQLLLDPDALPLKLLCMKQVFIDKIFVYVILIESDSTCIT